MYFYQAYGLIINSVLALPDLTPADSQNPHVEIRWATEAERRLLAGQTPPQRNQRMRCTRLGRQRSALNWNGVGQALIQFGGSISLTLNEAGNLDRLRFHLLDSGLAVLLQQRGLLPLPASVIGVGTSGVAFMKASNQSHLAISTALHQTGLPLLADHIAAIDLNFEIPLLRPAYPSSMSGSILDSNPFLHQDEQLRHAIPLKGIYLLTKGDSLGIKPLTVRQALPAFLMDWYGGRFGEGFLNWNEWVSHCRRCYRLAESVPCWRLNRPVTNAARYDTTDLILDHILSPALQRA